jgi:chromosome segregation ATPase
MNDTPKNGQPTYAMLVNAMLAKMSDRALIAENQLTAVTEQRDRLAEALANLVSANETWNEAREETIRTREFMDHGFAKARDELTTVTEQRDRLAEALRECREDSVELLDIRDWWKNEPRCNYKKRYQETRDNVTRANDALQSLTPNEL